MKEVLFVDCCIRGNESRTRRLADRFLAALDPAYHVTRLNLMEENLPYFKGDYFVERQRLLETGDHSHIALWFALLFVSGASVIGTGDRSHPRFHYAHQFAKANLIVIAAPFWDLSFPALLKVYIEQVSVDGITFGSTEKGLQGLCQASDMVFLTTRGGFYTDDDMEMGSRYLDALHTFFGVGRYHCIAADGMDVAGFDAEGSLREAEMRAQALAASL